MTDLPADGPGAAPPQARRRLNPTLARYLSAFRTPKGAIGLSILVLLVLAALLAPVLFPGGYDQQGRHVAHRTVGRRTSSASTSSAATSSSAASTACAST